MKSLKTSIKEEQTPEPVRSDSRASGLENKLPDEGVLRAMIGEANDNIVGGEAGAAIMPG